MEEMDSKKLKTVSQLIEQINSNWFYLLTLTAVDRTWKIKSRSRITGSSDYGQAQTEKSRSTTSTAPVSGHKLMIFTVLYLQFNG